MYVMEHVVHLSDTDATGQVYYARPLEWFEWCRVDWFNGTFGDFLAETRANGISYFPAQAHIDYRRPLFCGDKIRIEMSVGKTNLASFDLEHAVFKGDEIMVTCRITMVGFDLLKKRPTRLEEFRLIKLKELLAPRPRAAEAVLSLR